MSTTSDAILFEILEEMRGLRADLNEIRRERGQTSPESDVNEEEVAEVQPTEDRSLQSILGRYYAQKAVEVSEAHLEGIKAKLDKFVNWLPEGATMDRLTKSMLVAYKEDLMTLTGMKPVTLNKHLSALSAFCNWAVSHDLLEDNPIQGLKLKSSTDQRGERQALTEDQVNLVLKDSLAGTVKCSNAWISFIIAFSGMRSSEVAGLKVGDLQMIDGYWTFNLTRETRKTAASSRIIPVHSKLLEKGLLQLRGDAEEDDYLFRDISVGVNGRRASASGRHFTRTLMPHKGLTGVSQYGLRHSFITALLQNEVPEGIVSTLAGHTDGNITTGRYCSGYKMAQLVEAIEKLPWK
jgi:integrase